MKYAMNGILLCLGIGCRAVTEPTQRPATGANASVVRVAFIADTHVIGPQYTCCSESDGIDNESIMKTEDRLRETVELINAIEPKVAHVFVLGDVVHDGHHGHDLTWYQNQESAFSRAASILSDFQMPVHILWGNHDYEVSCGGGADHHSRTLSHQLFSNFFGASTHGSVEIGGWRFIMLNSQLGPTWDASDDRCDTELGSYGAEQLAWLDGELADGLPSIVLSHHHMITSTARNENDGDHPDLSTVLGRHDNVAVHLAGHLHRWMDLPPTEEHPVRHIILGATRYDTDNFWVAEMDSSGSFEIVDYDKSKWNTTCAETWSYDENVGPQPGSEEQGDCGTLLD